jgi:hypothetical protein
VAYRTLDPMANMAIRVTMRRVTAALEAVGVYDAVEDTVIRWQEKRYSTVRAFFCFVQLVLNHDSQEEIVFYAMQDNCMSLVDLQHHARVQALLAEERRAAAAAAVCLAEFQRPSFIHNCKDSRAAAGQCGSTGHRARRPTGRANCCCGPSARSAPVFMLLLGWQVLTHSNTQPAAHLHLC